MMQDSPIRQEAPAGVAVVTGADGDLGRALSAAS